MYIEVIHQSLQILFEYQSDVAPSVGETVQFQDEYYDVEAVRHDVEEGKENNIHIDGELRKVSVLVSEKGEETEEGFKRD
jgi:hypothetical protein